MARVIVVGASAFLLVGCFFGPPEASGTITTTEEGATTTVTVDSCAKVGDNSNQPGVELLSGSEAIIRVVPDDLLGASITIAGSQPNQGQQLTESACGTWSFSTHYNGYSVDHDPEIDGSLDAVCTLPSGGTMEAHTTFSNCS